MRRRGGAGARAVVAGLAAAAALAFGAPSAAAGGGSTPLIVDPSGDANGLNGQGLEEGLESGPDTRPASIDGADIRAVDFATSYRTEKVLDPDGSVRELRHIADGLRVTVTMEGDVLPTVGPSLMIRIPATVELPDPGPRRLCDVSFEAWWRGPNAPEQHLQQPDIRREFACRFNGTISSGFALSIDGPVIAMDYPFDAPSMTQMIRDGTEIRAPVVTEAPRNVFTALQTLWFPIAPPGYPYGEGPPTYGRLDEAPRFTGFTVGSDVPPDVDCTATPDHPGCSS